MSSRKTRYLKRQGCWPDTDADSKLQERCDRVVTGLSNCSAANAGAVEAPPRPGDQVKIGLNCRPEATDGWATTEAVLARWAADRGIIIAGAEVIVESPHIRRDVDPEQLSNRMLIDLANQERLSDEQINIGLALLKEL